MSMGNCMEKIFSIIRMGRWNMKRTMSMGIDMENGLAIMRMGK